jgi:hypothetical protein
MYYQCLNGCTVFGYSLRSYNGGLVCLPYPWINGFEQIYLTAYDPAFYGSTYQTSSELIVFDTIFINQSTSTLTINLTLNPYYKLALFIKQITVGLGNSTLQSTFTLTDNSSTT